MDSYLTITIAALASFCAGYIDAVAGGGGLIQVPALLILFPTTSFPILAGTNKIAAVCGTTVAARRYLRRLKVDRSFTLYSSLPAIIGSFIGAYLATAINKEIIRPLVVVALIGVFIFTLLRPKLGNETSSGLVKSHRAFAAAIFGAALGVYDGLIGPGTGSFLLFGGVVLFGLDFLRASASAKVINICTNLAALLYFISAGQFIWQLALVMAICNVCGAEIGARHATAKGNYFVRRVFLVVVPILILKLAYDIFL